MMDSFSDKIPKLKDEGRLIFKNLGVKALPKTYLTPSYNDVSYIDISENKFTTIPDISNFLCLEALICSHNNIRSLSSNLTNLVYLEILDLSCNHLTSLNLSICKLECLKIFLISSNRLVSLPMNIGSLKNLEELDASCNGLTCLPDELSMLKNLKFLNLRHNKLLDVPISLSTLSLEILDLSENQLSSIPCEYHKIETLQSFNLSGNPLTFPPANVCNRGLLHVMKYLQSEFRRQTQRQHIKLGSQVSTDYSTLNNNQFSESIHFDMNANDSINSTSTNSFPSAIDLEQDFDNEYQESKGFHYLPPTELIQNTNFKRQDSGYNTITNVTKYDLMMKFNHDRSKHKQPYEQADGNSLSNTATENSETFPAQTIPNSASYRDDIVKKTHQMIGQKFKKSKNYCSTSSPISQVVSPQTVRSNRFNSRNRISEPHKVRRSSLPNEDFAEQANNFANHDVDVSTECVVVVDNNEPAPDQEAPSNSHAQFNNNNSDKLNLVSYSSLRRMKTRNSEPCPDRNLLVSKRVYGVIPEQDYEPYSDVQYKRQEAIKRFHKIIEAQVHVHINFKDLSKELANGIYLCYLANVLIPNCILVVHTPSPGQQELGKQKSKRNLENFLETCRRNGVSEVNLFSPNDVINCKPNSLYQMSKSVDAFIQSIRVKKSRQTSSCKPWREVLANPQTLSDRYNNVHYQYQYRHHYQPRTSTTTSRSSKSSNEPKIIHKSKSSNDEIIQISSEV